MSLLSAADITEIRAAIKQTTDTFMVSPIVYHRSAGGSVDIWQEDKPDENFVSYVLSGLVEDDNAGEADKVERMVDGSVDYTDVTLTFNFEDLEAIGVTTAQFDTIFNEESDYFTLRDKVYRVEDIYKDGPLTHKPALVIIRGSITNKVIDFGVVTIPPVEEGGMPATDTITNLIADLTARVSNNETGLISLLDRLVIIEGNQNLKLEDLPPIEGAP